MKVTCSTGKSETLPSHMIHCQTLREALTYCCNLRMVPKKVTLRALAEYCSNPVDKAQLLWWSSGNGSHDYAVLLSQGTIIPDIFRKCPSCR